MAAEQTDRTFEDRVRAILYDVLATDPDRQADNAYLVQDLGADSLDVVEFSFELEEEFEVSLEELDLSKAITVRDVIEAIRSIVRAHPEGR